MIQVSKLELYKENGSDYLYVIANCKWYLW